MINLEPSLLCLRGDVTSNWVTFNPILKLNEPAIEIFNDGNVKMKIGNGVNNFLDLPYLNEADNVNSDWNSTGGLSEILNKPTTVSGYGLSDVYTINEVDFKILTIQEASNSTNGFMSINDFIKLSGISSGATKNDTDQNLKNRQNHTGTQLSNTISDFVKSVNDSQLSEIYIDNTDVTSGDTVCSSINKLQSQNSNIKSNLSSHVNNVNNPHGVTKHQIDLGSVDNTSDMNKPISISTQNALNLKVDKTTSIVAGSGLTGGGILSGNTTINVVSLNDGILVNNDNIELKTINDLTTVSTTKPLSAAQGKALQDNKADKTTNIIAGSGLTGGGDLSSSKTINVVSANDAITVNADNIQLNTIDNLTTISTTKPLSANQGKILNDKYSQLETDLNIKNAEQDASIKSIEQLLSQSNLNQTAQVSISGREIVSLPKTASNGGMDIKLEGLTAQNLVANGDFRSGTTGWTALRSVNTVLNNTLINTGNGTHSNPFVQLPTIQNRIGDIAYLRYKFRVTNSNCKSHVLQGGGFSYTLSSPIQNLWYNISQRATVSIDTQILLPHSYEDAATANGKVMEVQRVIYVNLTATFGAGNEPDLATCDAMFSTYFEGTKSFIPTGRVRSRIGINMFNPSDFVKNGISNGLAPSLIGLSGNGIFNKYISYIERYFDYLKGCFEPNTQYTLKATGKISNYPDSRVAVNLQFTYTDMSAQSISFRPTESTVSMTSQPGKTISHVGLSNWGYTGELTIWDISLTKGSTQVPYEPYKSTKLYLTAPDLRSNGNVKDEIRKGANGYEHVKRVGIGTLGEDKITNVDDREFTIDTGFWIKGTGWTISGGTLNRDGTAATSDCYRTTGIIATIGKYYKITLYANVQLGQFKVAYGSAFSPFIKSTGKYVFYLKAILADGFYFTMSGGFSGSIENVSIKEVVTSDLILNETITEFGTDIYYSLATPISTPIEHAGMLNSTESGTVFHEPVVADAGVYGTNLTVFNTTYPISSLEEIMVHTNVDTYLDVSKAVIASNGLSFTHPDLRAGDLVLYTYFFNKEKVNGLITATYYDGRYVIADTANGKFYKWGVKSTNGVATIQLTEV